MSPSNNSCLDEKRDEHAHDPRDCPLCAQLGRPNATTLAAMKELEDGRGHRCSSVEELMKDLNAD